MDRYMCTSNIPLLHTLTYAPRHSPSCGVSGLEYVVLVLVDETRSVLGQRAPQQEDQPPFASLR